MANVGNVGQMFIKLSYHRRSDGELEILCEKRDRSVAHSGTILILKLVGCLRLISVEDPTSCVSLGILAIGWIVLGLYLPARRTKIQLQHFGI